MSRKTKDELTAKRKAELEAAAASAAAETISAPAPAPAPYTPDAGLTASEEAIEEQKARASIVIKLTPDGKADIASMRGKTLERLRDAIEGTELAPVPTMEVDATLAGTAVSGVGNLFAVAIIGGFKLSGNTLTGDQAKTLMLTEEEKDELAGPMAAVLPKYLAMAGKNQGEVMLAWALFSVYSRKIQAVNIMRSDAPKVEGAAV